MRIIAGVARGVKLQAPSGLKTRPTAERTKEGIFSAISMRLSGASFLDLFAGSGQNGLEALSRGASHAVFVENGKEALKCLHANAKATKLLAQSTIWAKDAEQALRTMREEGRWFDIIYIDPPWAEATSFWQKHNQTLATILAPNGVLLLENSEELGADESYTKVKRYRYGSAFVTMYQKRREVERDSTDGGDI